MTDLQPDWRQRKKAATRERIRGSALRLFREQGYDATTVEQIAAAAGVSHMTFFRYFSTKEDVALSDSYDPMIAALLEQTPATWPLPRRIRAALLHGLQQVYDSDRDALLAQNTLIVSTPVLREWLWAGQMAGQEAILRALGLRADFQARVITAACLAAASTPSSPGSRTTAPRNCPTSSTRPSKPSPTARPADDGWLSHRPWTREER